MALEGAILQELGSLDSVALGLRPVTRDPTLQTTVDPCLGCLRLPM